MNNVLALDLGTKTGFCFNQTGNGDPRAGTLCLATTKELKTAKLARLDRRCDFRIVTFRDWVLDTVNRFGIRVIVFEDVQFSKFTLQTQLWSSLRGALWTVPDVFFECVPVSTLKKFATGSGWAQKEDMKRAFDRYDLTPFKRPENDLDDNGIDATFIWLWAMKNLNRVRL